VNAATGYTDMFTNNEILGPGETGRCRGVATMLPAGPRRKRGQQYVYTGLSREFGQVAAIRRENSERRRRLSMASPLMGTGPDAFLVPCVPVTAPRRHMTAWWTRTCRWMRTAIT